MLLILLSLSLLPLDSNEAFQFMGLEEGRLTQHQVYISQDSLLADEVILLLALLVYPKVQDLEQVYNRMK